MGFYNPFSAKPDYGSGIQELLGQLAQMLMIKKMGNQGGQPQLPPGAASAMAGAGAQGGMPMPMGRGQASVQPQGAPGGQSQQTLGKTPVGNSLLSAQDIQALSSQLPPQIMAIIAKLLAEGKFPQAGGGQAGR